MSVNVALIVPQTEAEGPGVRYAVWVQGCPMRCPGCCNPEMLPFVQNTERSTRELIDEACALSVEGVTFLGGEPFSQAGALAVIAEGVRARGLSVMIFSGFTLDELRATNDPDTTRLLAATDLLVDGRYDETRRTVERRWIGSDNQVMHFLSDRYRPDDPRFAGANHLELRFENKRVTLNGWPVHGARTRF